MLKQGATTLWESWEYPDNGSSQNHPMFGSIDEWFYRSILGINPASPGFKKIIIKPQPAGDLTWAKGSYNSISGKITSDWKITNGKFYLNVSIPPNTSGEIWVPSNATGPLMESGKTFSGNVNRSGRYAVVAVGSGEYTFESDMDK
jgi:alpha-L-rhamnosidase